MGRRNRGEQFSFVDLDVSAAARRFALLRRAHDTGLLSVAVVPAVLDRSRSGGASTERSRAQRAAVGTPLVGPEWAPQGPRLSPDGSRLAFFGNGRLCLCDLNDLEGAAAIRPVLDRPDLDAGFCEWSPDGTRLVFSAYPPPGTRTAPGLGPDIFTLDLHGGALTQLTRDFAVNRFPQWVGRSGLVAFHRQDPPRVETPMRVLLADTVTGRETPLPETPGAWCRVGRFCATSDGRFVVYSESGPSFTGLRVARTDTGEVVWSLERPAAVAGAFTPDGLSLLAVCGGSGEGGVEGGELLWYGFPDGDLHGRLTLAGRFPPPVHTLTGPALGFPESPADSDDPRAHRVLFLGADSRIYRWEIGTARRGSRHTGSTGRCAALPAPRGIPAPDRPALPGLREASYESATRDGRQTPVCYFALPAPRPLAVLFVHGGPPVSGTAAFAAEPHPLRDLLLRAGYEVVVPAYRGTDENEGEYGRADLWEVIDAARDWDARIGKGRRPLVVVGYSYGGYLALMALAEGRRTADGGSLFDRGAALWPVTHPFGGHAPRWFPPDADAAARARRLPAERADDIRAPLLLLAGGRDTISTDPAVVARLVRSLTSRGVPCEAVTYPDDTHSLPGNRADADVRLLAFLEATDSPRR